MNSNNVVFIAFEERDNLGVAYLASVLSEAGYHSEIIDFRESRESILNVIKECKPVLLGFSVIFQYHISDFIDLAKYLRENGIECHFTAGGHFASLRPQELFDIIPELDSLVRFEGEYTLLELVQALNSGKEWKKIIGLSYMENGKLVHNDLRPLEPDLDNFPWPVRNKPGEYALGKTYATILAGRGCVHDCIFCDIREFYGPPPGPYKRIRSPVKVIEEIKHLYHDEKCSVFLFQDDDFPLIYGNGNDWVRRFCKELSENDLKGKILWKINCRPDEVDQVTFSMMKDHGLYQVFLGIEDGTDEGLKNMNKNLRASDTLRGIGILKDLDIGIDYGFMLFQPDSTFDSIRTNLMFLDTICANGYMSVTFLKMMPHFATKVEARLEKQCRLKKKDGIQDYDFLENTIDDYYGFVFDVFSDWLQDPRGLLNTSMWARNFINVYKFFNGATTRIHFLSYEFKQLKKEANHFILDTMFELADIFESGNYKKEADDNLDKYRSDIKEKHEHLTESFSQIIRRVMIQNNFRELFRV
ncbi:MAG: B12-binding domain-containing radical SAM protein [Bacteroidales bacterium]|nr:B12-binding domain-containing radical SAM protein [Bacteroidales bacterium]